MWLCRVRCVYGDNVAVRICLKAGASVMPGGRYVAAVLNVVTASAIPLRCIVRRITLGYSKLFYVKQLKTIDYICPKARVILVEFCCG